MSGLIREPWRLAGRLGSNARSIVAGEGGAILVRCSTAFVARRVLACVNACGNIGTEELMNGKFELARLETDQP